MASFAVLATHPARANPSGASLSQGEVGSSAKEGAASRSPSRRHPSWAAGIVQLAGLLTLASCSFPGYQSIAAE